MNNNLIILGTVMRIIICITAILLGLYALTQSFNFQTCAYIIGATFLIVFYVLGLKFFKKEIKSANAENYDYYSYSARMNLLSKDAIKNLWLTSNDVHAKLNWTDIKISDGKRSLKITADRNTIVNLWLSLCPYFDNEGVTYDIIIQTIKKSGIINLPGVKIKEMGVKTNDTKIGKLEDVNENESNGERNIDL